jgi:hypothetical protein
MPCCACRMQVARPVAHPIDRRPDHGAPAAQRKRSNNKKNWTPRLFICWGSGNFSLTKKRVGCKGLPGAGAALKRCVCRLYPRTREWGSTRRQPVSVVPTHSVQPHACAYYAATEVMTLVAKDQLTLTLVGIIFGIPQQHVFMGELLIHRRRSATSVGARSTACRV